MFQRVPKVEASMGDIADNCNLDIDAAEEARALHRVVRAMHDGHCPCCSHLGTSESFYTSDEYGTQHRCPRCRFTITENEAAKALGTFSPFLKRSVDVFERWRDKQRGPMAVVPIYTAVIGIGNSDDKLSQAIWSDYVASVRRIARDYTATTIYFDGTTQSDSPRQSASIVFDISRDRVVELRRTLGVLCHQYAQDAIALTVGSTDMIGTDYI